MNNTALHSKASELCHNLADHWVLGELRLPVLENAKLLLVEATDIAMAVLRLHRHLRQGTCDFLAWDPVPQGAHAKSMGMAEEQRQGAYMEGCHCSQLPRIAAGVREGDRKG